jgi:hypothetical protein
VRRVLLVIFWIAVIGWVVNNPVRAADDVHHIWHAGSVFVGGLGW